MTQKNDFSTCSEELNPFLIWPEELTFLEKWVKHLNPFWIWPKNWTLISWIWRKELNPLFLEYDAMNWTVKFLEYDAKNGTVCSNKTKRIGPFFQIWLQEKIFSTPRIELFFLNTTHRIQPFFFEYDQRIGLFFLEYDAKNWNLFFEYDAKNRTFCSNMIPRNEPCFKIWLQEMNWIWLTELNFLKIWLTELNFL